MALYVRALSDLSAARLEYAFTQALRRSRYFPFPSELREFASEWRPAIDDSKAILNRGDKPPGWVPLDEIYREMNKACAWPKPPAMTAEELEKRIAELKKQAADLAV